MTESDESKFERLCEQMEVTLGRALTVEERKAVWLAIPAASRGSSGDSTDNAAE